MRRMNVLLALSLALVLAGAAHAQDRVKTKEIVVGDVPVRVGSGTFGRVYVEPTTTGGSSDGMSSPLSARTP